VAQLPAKEFVEEHIDCYLRLNEVRVRTLLMKVRRADRVPRLVVWYGNATFYFGVLCFPLAVVLGVGTYLYDGGDILGSFMTVVDVCALAAGICGFGAAVSRGLRPVLLGLLLIILFGSGLVGYLFTLGLNPEYGHYLWAAAGAVSLPLALVLAVYWKRLPRGQG
jgi:hypothetical protein